MVWGHRPFGYALVASALLGAGALAAATDSSSGPSRKPSAVASPAAAVVVPQTAQAAASARPRCFGAASMAKRPCRNRALKGMLVLRPALARRDIARFPGKQCYQSGVQQIRLNRGCTFGTRSARRPHVILVGDSHARAILPAFVAMAEAGHISLEAQVRGSCSWTTSRVNHPDKSRVRPCTLYRKNLQRWLLRQARTTDVVVTTGYARQVSGSAKSQVIKMRDRWRPVIKRGVRVIAISDNPRLKREPQKCLAKYGATRGARKCGVSTKAGLSRDPFLLTAKKTRGATALDLRPRFCKNGFCPAVIGGANVYRDHTHISATYARTLAPALTAKFRSMRILR